MKTKNKQRQKQKQIPCGDDKQKGKDNKKATQKLKPEIVSFRER